MSALPTPRHHHTPQARPTTPFPPSHLVAPARAAIPDFRKDTSKKSNLIKLIRWLAAVVILAILIQKAASWRSYARRAESSRRASATLSTNDTVELRMHAAALLAIATVEPHARTPFNFSPESLQHADDMIRRLLQTVSQTNRNEELFYACR